MGNELEIKVVPQQQPRRGAIPIAAAAPSTAEELPQEHERVLHHDYRKRGSWLVPVFVMGNILIFVVTMYVNDCPRNSNSCVADFLGRFSFQTMKENPLLGPTSATLEEMGALDVYKVSHQHQLWRLFTCIWLHAGVFHVLANMLSLVFIGIRLEQEFGFVLVGLLYVISGFGGSLLMECEIRVGRN